jgi:AcrR family transcriptional regulator
MPVVAIHDDGSDRGDIGLVGWRPEPPLTMLNPGTRTSAHPAVVEQILEAAIGAVADHGLDGLSMEDIAVRAGCSRATVYRRVGGKDAIRDALLDHALVRITASVMQAVGHLAGDERVARVIVASLDTIRADPVSAALLTGPAPAQSVSSALITQVNDTVAQLAGLDPDDSVGCELISRLTLSLLCWPASDRRTELAIIRRHVSPFLLDPRPDLERADEHSAVRGQNNTIAARLLCLPRDPLSNSQQLYWRGETA